MSLCDIPNSGGNCVPEVTPDQCEATSLHHSGERVRPTSAQQMRKSPSNIEIDEPEKNARPTVHMNDIRRVQLTLAIPLETIFSQAWAISA
jgi:hypothetical protein